MHIKKGRLVMKCLKIEDNKGMYSIDGEQWINIDQINKEHLLKLLEIAVDEQEFEMDEFDENKLGNKAHLVIYKNLYSKFKDLLQNKTRFKDESENVYKEAIEKYKK